MTPASYDINNSREAYGDCLLFDVFCDKLVASKRKFNNYVML